MFCFIYIPCAPVCTLFLFQMLKSFILYNIYICFLLLSFYKKYQFCSYYIYSYYMN